MSFHQDARVRIIRGPPRGLRVALIHATDEEREKREERERATEKKEMTEAEDREKDRGDRRREESTGPKQGHQKIPRTTNHRGGLRLPQMPAQREKKGFSSFRLLRACLSSSFFFSSPSSSSPSSCAIPARPFRSSLALSPGRSFSRAREDLSSPTRERRQSDLYSNESRWKPRFIGAPSSPAYSAGQQGAVKGEGNQRVKSRERAREIEREKEGGKDAITRNRS